MNYRKLLAIFLTLALALGMTLSVGADGTVGGQTDFDIRVASETDLASTGDQEDKDIKFDETGPIVVTVTNIYNIQVNPYGMNIDVPGTTKKSTDRIITAPVIIKNHTNVMMEVTATATVTSTVIDGKDSIEFEPDDTNLQEPFIPDEFDDSTTIPHEERVYLYLQMVGDYDPNVEWDEQEWDKEDKKVITKPSGSDPLTVTMAKGSETVPSCAALKIGGVTSIPSGYGTWSRGCGFDVTVVLSFMPKLDNRYNITFDAFDYKQNKWPTQTLIYPVEFLIDSPESNTELNYPAAFIGENDSRKPLKLDVGYQSTSSDMYTTPGDSSNLILTPENSLTFTVKTADEAKGSCYTIRDIILFRGENNEAEKLYAWDYNKQLVQYTITLNAADIDPGEKLTIHVILNQANIT